MLGAALGLGGPRKNLCVCRYTFDLKDPAVDPSVQSGLVGLWCPHPHRLPRLSRPYALTHCLDALAESTARREQCAVVTLRHLAQRGALAAPLRRPPPALTSRLHPQTWGEGFRW